MEINNTNTNIIQVPSGSQGNSSGFAVASMVLGIVGLFVSWCALGIPSLLAVIFGHVALHWEIPTKGKSGKGMAITGLVLGYIALVPAILILLFSSAVTTLG